MSRKKKDPAVSDEPRIHRVVEETEAHHESHQISPDELYSEEDIPEEEYFLDPVKPLWEDVKDSIETLRLAWEKVHGVRLANSDLYSLMHTSDHFKTVNAYLEL